MPYYHWKKIVTYLIIGFILGFVVRGFVGGTFDDGWQAAREKLGVGNEVKQNANGEYELLANVVKVEDKVLQVNVDLGPLSDREEKMRTVKIDEDDTVITLRRVKTEVDWLTDADRTRLLELQSQFTSTERRELEEIQALEAEISTLQTKAMINRTKQTTALRSQLAALPADDASRADLQKQLEALGADYVYQTVSWYDIKAGDSLVIRSADKDLANDMRFTAKSIEIQR